MLNVKTKKSSRREKMGVANSIIIAVLTLYSLSMIILFMWGVFTALKSRNDFYYNKILWPKGHIWEWAWSNFSFVWKNFAVVATNTAGQRVSISVGGQVANTLLYAGGCALVSTLSSCVVAYLTSRYKYFFSKVVYTFVLVTMVIPIIGSTPSMILFLKRLNLYDNFLGTYMMKFNFLNFYFLIMHATFARIPKEMSEAATIDGAGDLQIFVRVMFPLIIPTFSTVFLIHFIEFWNDYQTALLYMPSHPTLAYGVYYMSVSNKNGLSSEPMRLCSCVIMAMPILVLFIAFRNRIMGNMTMGGVKE